MSQQIAPLTGFGDVHFTVMSDDGRVSDWHRELVVNEAKSPSSNQTITQIDGFGPWTYEVRLLFACADDWQRFEAMRGTSAALTHLADTSAYVPLTARHYELGDDYVTWTSVLYKTLKEPPRMLRGGRVIARVVFQREDA